MKVFWLKRLVGENTEFGETLKVEKGGSDKYHIISLICYFDQW